MTAGIPLYVINLERDFDRWESVLLETAESPFDAIRIEAVNATELGQQDFVSTGVNAAWLSHLKAMKTFLESGAQFALIAEDDFHIVNRSNLVTRIEQLRPKEWDMVQLGFLKPGLDTRIKITFANAENLVFRFLGTVSSTLFFSKMRFSSRMRVSQSLGIPRGYVLDDCQPGAHFYLVRRSFCEAVIQLNNPQFLSIDDFYAALSRMRTFRMLRSKRNLSTQKPFAAWSGPRFKREL
jgi:GR25 family glycosyltransferase involved in LPS biosynthesis